MSIRFPCNKNKRRNNDVNCRVLVRKQREQIKGLNKNEALFHEAFLNSGVSSLLSRISIVSKIKTVNLLVFFEGYCRLSLSSL